MLLLLFAKLWDTRIPHIKILRVIFFPFIHLIIADILPLPLTFSWSRRKRSQIRNIRHHCCIYIRSGVNLLQRLLSEFTFQLIIDIVLFIGDITVWLVNYWRIIHLRCIFIGIMHSLCEGLFIIFLVCVRHTGFVIIVLTFLITIKRFSRTSSIC